MFEPVALNASLGSFGNKKERKRKEATGKEGQQVWFLFYCLLWEFSSLFLLFSLIIKFLIVLCFLAWLDFPSLAICLISFSLSSINHCGYPLSPWLDRGYWGLFLFFFCYLLLFFFFFFFSQAHGVHMWKRSLWTWVDGALRVDFSGLQGGLSLLLTLIFWDYISTSDESRSRKL